jgi:hypothetical protein
LDSLVSWSQVRKTWSALLFNKAAPLPRSPKSRESCEGQAWLKGRQPPDSTVIAELPISGAEEPDNIPSSHKCSHQVDCDAGEVVYAPESEI